MSEKRSVAVVRSGPDLIERERAMSENLFEIEERLDKIESRLADVEDIALAWAHRLQQLPPVRVKIKRLHLDARLPTRATEGSVGLDLYALTVTPRPYGYDCTTGLAIELPSGWEAQVRPRSGLTRLGWMAAIGTVDADFRGEIGVTIHASPWDKHDRSGNHVYREPIKAGMRVAQLVVQTVPRVELVEVDELSETVRGANGFGSTGQ